MLKQAASGIFPTKSNILEMKQTCSNLEDAKTEIKTENKEAKVDTELSDYVYNKVMSAVSESGITGKKLQKSLFLSMQKETNEMLWKINKIAQTNKSLQTENCQEKSRQTSTEMSL